MSQGPRVRRRLSPFALRPFPLILLLLLSPARAADTQPAGRPDLLVADFEGSDYGAWKAEGEAFGSGPARGTLPGQMKVEGFLGKGLVNSYKGGDKPQGTLTSPPFRIERRYLRFLIGGGGYDGETCINLLVGGKAVRTATGPNTSPGGSEELEGQQWDVADLAGQEAVIQIVDRRSGGWGHINVDHIVQTDSLMPAVRPEACREMLIEKRYLNLPIKNGAPRRVVTLTVDDKPVRRSDIELADAEPDYWAVMDVAAFKGKHAALWVKRLPANSAALGSVEQGDSIKGAEDLYREKLRPQFHFSQRRGWNNDPNGLVYYAGEYHLFFQHNPYGWRWGNMHWGHAVSKDLVHWEELPTALYPWTQAKAHCYSGSAAVDHANTAGFQAGADKAIVAAFTDTGCGEALAYSTDRGRTWTYYDKNPVVTHKGRDPKIFWYAPGKHWVMALYDEHEGKRWIAFHTSPDLKEWTFASRIEGYFECPDIFELPVEGRAGEARWVLFAADAKYAIGKFDGKAFTPEHEGKHQVHWGAYYASQTYNDAPDGRRIQIGWARIEMKGMPFNQMMSFPAELKLRRTDEGLRMFAAPVKELERLRARSQAKENVVLKPGAVLEVPVGSNLLEVRAEFDLGQPDAPRPLDAKWSFGLQVGQRKIAYDVAKQDLYGMPVKPDGGKVRMHVLVDRPSMEIFANDGRAVFTADLRNVGEFSAVQAYTDGADARLTRLEVHELKSTWR